MRSELEQIPDREPDSWNPSPGDLIVGAVLGWELAETKYGSVEMLILEEEAELPDRTGRVVSVWLTHTVLRNEIGKAQLSVGDRIGIRRLADNEAKGYARYKVVVEHQNASGNVAETKSEFQLNRSPSQPEPSANAPTSDEGVSAEEGTQMDAFPVWASLPADS